MTHRDDLNLLVTLLDCDEGEWDWNGPAPDALRRVIRDSVDQAKTIAAAEALMSTMPSGTEAMKLDDDTVWPIDDPDASVEWLLRYAPDGMTRADQLHAAFLISAYSSLLDPNVPFSQVERKLRELRRKVKADYE